MAGAEFSWPALPPRRLTPNKALDRSRACVLVCEGPPFVQGFSFLQIFRRHPHGPVNANVGQLEDHSSVKEARIAMIIDQAFLQNVALLLLTAIVSGLGIPFILKIVEDRKLKGQKKFGAELARQEKLIESQSKLLDDLTQLLWKWRYLAKSVVYYCALNNHKRYEIARTQYEDSVWEILNTFRTEISRSRRLVSEGAFQKLNSLYDYVVHDIDNKVSVLIADDKFDIEGCSQMATRFSREVSEKLDDALNELASELQLKVRS